MQYIRYSLTVIFLCITLTRCSDTSLKSTLLAEKIDHTVLQYMRTGNIPGMSLVMIKDSVSIIKSYGFRNIETKESVSDSTLFELGSCSKAYTALLITYLDENHILDLSKYVSDYLPWFYTTYEDSTVQITLKQLLHHTGGIPWNTISKIPESEKDNALETTVRAIVGQELNHLPGEEFEYATINYDILALIAEAVSKKPFEDLMEEVIFNPLSLTSTKLGAPIDSSRMATGYKIGFFKARQYKAPRYKGNNAAGYVVSNAVDVSRWLKLQLGTTDTMYNDLIKITHQRDRSTALHGMSAYARGWNVNLDGTNEIYHDGLNPNFSSYLCFRPEQGLAIAVLTNSNSSFTSLLGDEIIKILAGEKLKETHIPNDNADAVLSFSCLTILVYILIALGYFYQLISNIANGKRSLTVYGYAALRKIFIAILAILPFLIGLYFLPMALLDFSWEALYVWTPQSALLATSLLKLAIVLSYLNYMLATVFPGKEELKTNIPLILLMTVLSGLSNVIVILMVTSVIGSEIEIYYLISYYLLAGGLYLIGRRFVQINLIKITRGIVLELRMKLIDKIFSTSYDKFERMDRGKVYTVLNDDVNAIGESTNLFVSLITCIITIIGAFVYLAALALWATVLIIGIILTITSLYYFVGRSVNKYYQQARDSRNTFMRLINNLLEGYKELSLKRSKKLDFKSEVEKSARDFKVKTSTADMMFANAFLVGESLLILLLGFVAIVMSHMFKSIQVHTITSFVIVFLYLIGPVNSILNTIPELLNMRIAWKRVQQFISEIPVNLDLNEPARKIKSNISTLEMNNICFQYQGEQRGDGFKIGPIDFKAYSGEIIFIVGGNGSGKTTLCKVLTGLYVPQEGEVMVNGVVQENYQLSEYFSTVFNPPYLLEKLYGIPLDNCNDEVEEYLRMLDLNKKVSLSGGMLSSISLSNGQRKRLALLQCYLENSPVYLFDEWASDQDPYYKHFFYHTILPRMKEENKIVIAITHDDQYFHLADRIFKMDQGQLKTVEKSEAVDMNLF